MAFLSLLEFSRCRSLNLAVEQPSTGHVRVRFVKDPWACAGAARSHLMRGHLRIRLIYCGAFCGRRVSESS